MTSVLLGSTDSLRVIRIELLVLNVLVTKSLRRKNIISTFFLSSGEGWIVARPASIHDKSINHHYIKGIVHQFWIYNIFNVAQQKKHFLLKIHLDKTTLTWNNWEKWGSKSVREYIHNLCNSTWSDWLWAPCFLNYFESELFNRDGPFLKNVFFLLRHKKMFYIQNWWTISLMP